MKNFEDRLGRLEEVTREIKAGDLPLAESITRFEEGIKLARSLEKDLEKMEKRVEVLLNPALTPATPEDPNLELFSELGDN